ncbi:hypothetical protein MCU_01392 [Bartonella elizabethae Re6043vi]|uniref:Uncharacterized protein n=2 Tax=Bartonella elizabethae TaxID=807 RepID=J0R5G6_BAREL|nr:hypothetical protein [Bartonella elizabethae]EJF82595.1 hypothetical protein MCU_01392 [Bartonella elizabethae Re6043vi]EJF93831.1 hypothetical protein MEE_01431 [Bartonella elizabethae F9251 = ATCC 49927]VEJ41906.1 Uncharacterised protein [Bartonella elizabethae]
MVFITYPSIFSGFSCAIFILHFFFPEDDSGDLKDQKYAFQDKNHPHYAPKLAAIVAAWEAVSEAAPSKNVKKTLIKWIREHAIQYKLVDDDNRPREKLIEE